jgi:chloramphenicol O-acetyltransferase
MSLIFDLDAIRKDNDKKIVFRFNDKSFWFWIKLRWFSITWTKCDVISTYSKFKTEIIKDINNLKKDILTEIEYNRNKPNIGKIGCIKRLEKILEKYEGVE